ncbi:putative SGNH hydrolase superfamily [Helianthus annuus]|nr:putative SGNH hydrolase superfamily [Helianthus annuus]KAJ0786958.1 putative SGNH hydrolase superfamily [Helianthus annuus]
MTRKNQQYVHSYLSREPILDSWIYMNFWNLGNSKLKPCCIATSSDANCGSLDENGKALYTVCKKPASTFFWDMFHPTQAGWRAVYLTLRSSLNRIFL